jgi:hypothetical protein
VLEGDVALVGDGGGGDQGGHGYLLLCLHYGKGGRGAARLSES